VTWWKRQTIATDSVVEQDPEVGRFPQATYPVRQRPDPGSRSGTERREGTDRGDAAQLQSREKLRRVWRHRGKRRGTEPCLQEDVLGAGNMADPMTGCGVQQTRRLSMRRKPSKLGGTARTERVRKVAAPNRRTVVLSEFGQPGVDARQLCRWRGDL
jgi:hypothetical protein